MQTDGQDEAISRFSKLCDRALKGLLVTQYEYSRTNSGQSILDEEEKEKRKDRKKGFEF
jgi:hypothetical protein